MLAHNPGSQCFRRGTALPSSARSARAVARGHAVSPRAKLVLVPTGSGDCSHLDSNYTLPQEIGLSPGLSEVGRDAPADIVVPVPTVSGRHAMIRVEGDTVAITDLSSTNGTFIGDVELEPMKARLLEVGREVTFGDTFLARFRLVDRPDKAAPEADDSS